MSDKSDEAAHKTGRIAMLCLTLCFLGCFVFAFKVDACASKPDPCRDEFFELKKDSNYNNHPCSAGATIEIVNSPPALVPGVFCHCNKTLASPAPSASAPTTH
jgi:hypothetical protein